MYFAEPGYSWQLVEHAEASKVRFAYPTLSTVYEFRNSRLTLVAKIPNCRKGVWTSMKSCHREVLKVYMNDARGTDLFIIGKLTAEHLDGTRFSGESVARMLLNDEDSVLRVLEYRIVDPVPSDPRPFLDTSM